MVKGRTVLQGFVFLLLFAVMSAGAGKILMNGTSIYLTTGEVTELYQGYAISLKSVSSDGLVWLQLTEGGNTVKSEIVRDSGYFIFNKTNMTILSIKVDKVYSGSPGQNLVSLTLFQFLDPDLPPPAQSGITPDNIPDKDNSSTPPASQPSHEPIVLALGAGLIIILFYIVRRFW